MKEKYAWKAKLLPNKKDEYIKRHREIWPELAELLTAAGIVNYSIWNVGDELFGYYECEKGVDFAAATQSNSEIVKKWDEFMKDIMVMEMDPITKAQPKLDLLWEFN